MFKENSKEHKLGSIKGYRSFPMNGHGQNDSVGALKSLIVFKLLKTSTFCRRKPQGLFLWF